MREKFTVDVCLAEGIQMISGSTAVLLPQEGDMNSVILCVRGASPDPKDKAKVFAYLYRHEARRLHEILDLYLKGSYTEEAAARIYAETRQTVDAGMALTAREPLGSFAKIVARCKRLAKSWLFKDVDRMYIG